MIKLKTKNLKEKLLQFPWTRVIPSKLESIDRKLALCERDGTYTLYHGSVKLLIEHSPSIWFLRIGKKYTLYEVYQEASRLWDEREAKILERDTIEAMEEFDRLLELEQLRLH